MRLKIIYITVFLFAFVNVVICNKQYFIFELLFSILSISLVILIIAQRKMIEAQDRRTKKQP